MKLLQKQREKINGIDVTYHGRLEGDLKVIPPHKCKHDKAYVYASNNYQKRNILSWIMKQNLIII